LNFPRFNKMKGMGQIVSWSVRDETLHTQSIIRLFRTFVAENPEIWNEDLERELYKACETIVTHEDAFIDLAFELSQLGLQPIYRTEKNPLPWLDAILNGVEHTNFFENRATEYSKAATRGTWEDAFD
jgi:ribonucleoside-diphosphate reductase beta chain